MDELLVDLEDYFSIEEELMKEADFFGYPMDEAEHDNMRKDFKRVYDEWKKEKSLRNVMTFLEEKLVPWFKLHVAQWDSVTAMHIGD